MKKEILEQMKVLFDIMASDEFTESVSNFCWSMYTKLKDKGFTDSQAIKIVTGMSKTK